MKLRKLEEKDAPRMLQWMHDKSVVAELAANFMDKTLDDCRRFIAASRDDREDLHLAVVNEEDAYMGTVSLKHIDRAAGNAEFAITVRADAMGKGYSRFGMEQILRCGTGELGLSAIYWCVSPRNARAVRFYDKCGYARTEQIPQSLAACYAAHPGPLIWYRYPAVD